MSDKKRKLTEEEKAVIREKAKMMLERLKKQKKTS